MIDIYNKSVDKIYKKLPKDIRNKLQILDDGNLSWHTLYQIEIAYSKLKKYNSLGLIEYRVIDNKRKYSPKPFAGKKKKLINQYLKIRPYLVSHNNLTEHQDTYIDISIPHPSEILKKLEDDISHEDDTVIKIILSALVGKKKLTDRTQENKASKEASKHINTPPLSLN